jgi:type IV secretory pathway TrbD component
MHFAMVKFEPKRPWTDFLAVILFLGSLSLASHVAGIGICPLRRLTGIPCPTCGATRAALALVRGELAAALGFHPLVTVLLLGAGLYALAAGISLLMTRRIPVVRASAKTWRRVAGILLLLAAASWACQIAGCGRDSSLDSPGIRR